MPPTLAGAGTYLFRISGYGFGWSRIRVIIKKKNEKKNGVVLLASILLCDEDVTLLFVCHPVPCRRKGG